IALDIIKKSGSWFSYNGERICQGKDKVRAYVESNPALMAELDAKIRSMKDQIPEGEDEFETEYVGDIVLHSENAMVTRVSANAGQIEVEGELALQLCAMNNNKKLRIFVCLMNRCVVCNRILRIC
ncbi:MAG: hypothetical protein J6V62_00700, partial [Paludibacteraceae bacterium]|nr:hypothetical protein [Paludibacteraceae bacterium]